MNASICETRIGRIGIVEENGEIIRVCLNADSVPPQAKKQNTALLVAAAEQLYAYLAGELRSFDLPLRPVGTPFMLNVWRLLCDIPYGQTASYRDIAVALGRPQAVRAVGQANKRNPIPIIIPCHRVIGSNGELVGYGSGLALKQALLELEGAWRPSA